MFNIVAYIIFVERYSWYFVVGTWYMGIGLLVVMCC
jgi:hypothetical protein